MAQSVKKTNDYHDKRKIGVITAVDPQKKTVDIQYVSQGGSFKALDLPYAIVGLTWGFTFMPLKGDKVILDNSDGDRPVIVSMHPNNVNYLPYLDPGEISMVCENGSYIFGRNKRKRAISSGALLDYDVTTGPNGVNDIEYEPGGIIIRARSKKNRDGFQPKWDNHSYISLFDNGDVDIQSMNAGITKALLYMEGTSGFTFWSSGSGKVSEYIEMNPITKEMVFFTDGDKHTHVQSNAKETIYQNSILQLGGGFQINLGVNVSTIPADFDQITATNINGPGDFYIDNSTSATGKTTLYLKGDFDITTLSGNINIITTNSASASSTITINSSSDIKLIATANVDVTATGNVIVQGAQIQLNGSSEIVATINDINNAIMAHTHPGVQNGPGSTSTGVGSISSSREVYTS